MTASPSPPPRSPRQPARLPARRRAASATAPTSSPGHAMPTARRPRPTCARRPSPTRSSSSRRRCCGGRCGRRAWATPSAAGAIVAAAGHSQGLLAALLVAEAGERGVDDVLLARYVRLAWAVGTHAARAASAGSEPPLAAVSGVRGERLAALVDDRQRARPAPVPRCRSRSSTRRGGSSSAARPRCSRMLRARLASLAREQSRARGAGRRGGAPLQFGWSALSTSTSPSIRRCSDGRARSCATGCAPSPARCPTRQR